MGIINTKCLSLNDIRELKGDSGLSQHQIESLYKRFMFLDRSQSGTIKPTDMLCIPELTFNPLRNRIIDALFAGTTDAKGINFREFLRFCSIFMRPKYELRTRRDTRERKLRFICHLFDVSGNGYISRIDFVETMHQMLVNTVIIRKEREAEERSSGSEEYDTPDEFELDSDFVDAIPPNDEQNHEPNELVLPMNADDEQNTTEGGGDTGNAAAVAVAVANVDEVPAVDVYPADLDNAETFDEVLLDEVKEMCNEVFGTRKRITYREFGEAMEDVHFETIMCIEKWFSTIS